VQLPPFSQGEPPPWQLPEAQESPTVHPLLSLQPAALFECAHPDAALQESLVQTFPSLQLSAGPPEHEPLEQVSLVVHSSPSLQGTELLTLWHPLSTWQESVVQSLSSSQLGAGPPTQSPPEQLSSVVHGLPSSQAPTASA
jgi:hypothetical protein